MSRSGRPGGECMAAKHALVRWVALEAELSEVRESSLKTCNDPATTPQTCPPNRRWELTNHPATLPSPGARQVLPARLRKTELSPSPMSIQCCVVVSPTRAHVTSTGELERRSLFPHRRHRLGRQFSGAGARPKPGTCQVRSEQSAGGQAASREARAFERGVGIATTDP
eukprot:scaffold35914_cov47-Phaeocystis_antarctica.AAC.3